MRRRALLAASAVSGDGNIFPMHLNLQKISNSEYRLDPTPESIALCDYFLENLQFDGYASWEMNIEPGLLFIDGIEVSSISFTGDANGVESSGYAYWYPYHERYDNFIFKEFSIDTNKNSATRGMFRVWNDD